MNGTLFEADELARREAEPDKRDREDDPTPRLAVRALLEGSAWYLFFALGMPPRVLDVCAGYGCWASEFRRMWSRGAYPEIAPHITGVEIYEARREHLRKWCDRVVIGDERDAASLGVFDLAIGNPHFSALVADDPADSMPARLLEHCRAVLLYHTRNAFLRSAVGREVWRRYNPARVFMLPGTVSHDGTSSVASDCYQATLWLRGHTGDTVEHLLDAEPAQANAAAGIIRRDGKPYQCWRWLVPPGSEEPSADLPAAPGWAP